MRTRRQHFGQHFLCDGKVIAKIADTVASEFRNFSAYGLLEIGPGRGALTLPLLNHLQSSGFPTHWTLIEKDHKLGEFWKKEISQHPESQQPEYIESDFLHFDALTHAHQKNLNGFYLYSNLPYSTGTVIFQKLTEEASIYPAMTLMFQKEVADRIQASPGTKAWGSLSLYAQNVWDVKKVLEVPPEAFKPPPKVQSAVLQFHRRKEERFSFQSVEEKKFWFSLIRRLFNNRRKMIRAILKSLESQDPQLLKALELAELSPQLRAETLDFDAWQRWIASFRQISGESSFSTKNR